MDRRLLEDVLSKHRADIVSSADPNDVFLNCLLDHLISKGCIQRDQQESIKRETVSRRRCAKLIDFVSSEGQRAFEEFCNALETADKRQIADSLRHSLREQRLAESEHADSLERRLCEEVLLKYRAEIISSADTHDVLLDRLLDHLTCARCMQRDQMELVKREKTSRTRCAKLLDFLSSQGQRAFDELCVALEQFETVDRKLLADAMRETLLKLRMSQCEQEMEEKIDEHQRMAVDVVREDNKRQLQSLLVKDEEQKKLFPDTAEELDKYRCVAEKQSKNPADNDDDDRELDISQLDQQSAEQTATTTTEISVDKEVSKQRRAPHATTKLLSKYLVHPPINWWKNRKTAAAAGNSLDDSSVSMQQTSVSSASSIDNNGPSDDASTAFERPSNRVDAIPRIEPLDIVQQTVESNSRNNAVS